MIRDITGNNSPMVLALKLLFDGRNINVFNEIALDEGFYTLFTKLILQTETSESKICPNNIFEYSRFFFYEII